MSNLLILGNVVDIVLFLTFAAAMLVQAPNVISATVSRAFSSASPRRPDPSAAWQIVLLLHCLLMTLVAMTLVSETEFVSFSVGAAVPLDIALMLNCLLAPAAAACALSLKRYELLACATIFAISSTPLLSLLGNHGPVALIIDAATSCAFVAWEWGRDRMQKASAPSFSSVAESLDAMPTGFACIGDDGRMLYANDTMRSCLRALGLQTDLCDSSGLWDSIRSRAQSVPSVGDVCLPLESGSYAGSWFRISDTPGLEHRKNAYHLVACTNVTEQVAVIQKIQGANRLLERSQEHMREQLRAVEKIANDEAAYRMTRRVHDTLGQRLSIVSRYLDEGKIDDASIEQIHLIMESLMADLGSIEGKNPSRSFDTLLTVFSNAGLSIEVDGTLPHSERLSGLIVDVVRESATNALQHADAHHMAISLHEQAGWLDLRLSNGGFIPSSKAALQEGCGLPRMRKAVQSAGGTMSIDVGPLFEIHIRVPLEGT